MIMDTVLVGNVNIDSIILIVQSDEIFSPRSAASLLVTDVKDSLC